MKVEAISESHFLPGGHWLRMAETILLDNLIFCVTSNVEYIGLEQTQILRSVREGRK